MMNYLLPLAATFIAVVAVALLVYALFTLRTEQRRALAERLQRHADKDSQTPTQIRLVNAGDSAELILEQEFSTIDAFDRLLKSSSLAERISVDLSRAGVPLRVGEYVLIRWLAGVALFMVFTFALNLNIVIGIVFGIIGFYLPRYYVSQQEKQRVKKINEQLVDALTMMSNSLKSGSSFIQALDLVAKEQPAPIGEEFGRVTSEARVGASIERSLLALGQRVRSYDLYLVITAILIQRESGGNLSIVLDNIVHTIAERQRILGQAAVDTAEQRLSAFIIGILPIALLFLMIAVNRSYISGLLDTFLGQIMLGAAIVLEVIGFFLIRQMSRIEV
jgi:tight adherence protein B